MASTPLSQTVAWNPTRWTWAAASSRHCLWQTDDEHLPR